jgi:hypothetical protein
LKVVAAEYEDCHVTVNVHAAEVRAWLNDSVDGNNLFRDVEIFLEDESGTPVSKTTLASAFIREFTISATDTEFLIKAGQPIRMVLVPESISTTSGGPNFNPVNQPIPNGSFSLDIDNVDGSRMHSVSELTMRVQKVLDITGASGIARFVPGQTSFDDLTLTAIFGNQTIAHLESWMANVAAGNSDTRDADLELIRSDGTHVSTVELSSLDPIEMLPFFVESPSESIFARRRSVKLRLGSFRFQ